MQKKNNKGVIALIIVLVLAAAALVIWQTNKPETQQGGKEITINVDHLNGDDTTFTSTPTKSTCAARSSRKTSSRAQRASTASMC